MAKEQTDVTYYILYPGDTEEHCVMENRILGTAERMKKYVDGKFLFYNTYLFRRELGYSYFQEILKKHSKKLDKLRIINSKGKQYTAEAFVEMLSQMEQII